MSNENVQAFHNLDSCNSLHKLLKTTKKQVCWKFVHNDELFYADVEDVKFVINLDYPSNSEDYVHRIGRTGRSQRTGTAYAFFTPNNAHKANDLIQVLEEANQIVNPKLYELSRNPGAYKSVYFAIHLL